MGKLDLTTIIFIGTIVSAVVAYAMVSLSVAMRMLSWRRPPICPSCGLRGDVCRCR